MSCICQQDNSQQPKKKLSLAKRNEMKLDKSSNQQKTKNVNAKQQLWKEARTAKKWNARCSIFKEEELEMWL